MGSSEKFKLKVDDICPKSRFVNATTKVCAACRKQSPKSMKCRKLIPLKTIRKIEKLIRLQPSEKSKISENFRKGPRKQADCETANEE